MSHYNFLLTTLSFFLILIAYLIMHQDFIRISPCMSLASTLLLAYFCTFSYISLLLNYNLALDPFRLQHIPIIRKKRIDLPAPWLKYFPLA